MQGDVTSVIGTAHEVNGEPFQISNYDKYIIQYQITQAIFVLLTK